MVGLGFPQQQQKKKAQAQAQAQTPLRSFFKARDDSPDSVIFTHDSSNISLFSSTSGSVDRCSFASDVQDRDSLVSEISKHLAGRELQDCSSGPDLEHARSSTHKSSNNSTRNGEKAKGGKEEDDTEGNRRAQYPAKNYFSQALQECKDRRLKCEVHQEVKKTERGRPVSVDSNNPGSNAGSPSPRLTVMKKATISSRKSGVFLSPGTPSYKPGNVGFQKGWSSERVPLPGNGNRRNGGAALLPLNSGRTLPSKWEDAEKWIFSPVSGDGVNRTSAAMPQRRPKSKSGPLGAPGHAYYAMYSPAIPMFDGRSIGNYMEGSPFSADELVTDGLPGRGNFSGGGTGVGESNSQQMEPCIVRSASIHGWSSDLLNKSSLPNSQDEKHDGSKDAATMVSHSVSRRDIATQMSPDSSTQSSPKGRFSFSPSPPPSFLPIVDPKSRHSSQLDIRDVRDVQVDDKVTVTRWSKKHGTRTDKGFSDVGDWRNKAAESQASAWEVAETPKSMSKSKREEAKILAWENLQKAKAEAAIRKLEMKLEKKRSSSMDKIMKKLKSAQKKAEDMRSSVSDNQTHGVPTASDKMISFRKRGQIGSLSGCFTCHAS